MTNIREYPGDSAGWAKLPVELTADQLSIGGWQVMQTWEAPLMDVMAREVTEGGGHILEIGFGMGISASLITSYGCASYTVIEAHPKVATLARDWTREQQTPCNVIEGSWQEVLADLEPRGFDGILFDTYPMSPEERGQNHFPFIPYAPRLLSDRGTLVCYSDETTEFRSEHLTLLLSRFDEVKLVKVAGLTPPADCEYWQGDHMIVPVARCPTRSVS
jgi:guanidinoacetate N-methyltransferase